MVTTIEGSRYSDKNAVGDNRVKNDWARGGGMNVPRMRRPEDQSPSAGLIMEVWASVASWFMKPDGSNLLSNDCPSITAGGNTNNVTNSLSSNKNNCRISSDIPLPFAPTICTAIRCTFPACNCDCFTPGKLQIRYCESCSHSWVSHALDKLGFRNLFGQTPVEPVQPNVVFDIASLVLYGCQALPIRLKILLDRLFGVLQKDEVTQILRGFGWTHEDYIRGYILQEAHGMILDRWNICSVEEEPLVLQQFLRFGETRTITEQLLFHQNINSLRHLPRVEAADLKKIVEKSVMKNIALSKYMDEGGGGERGERGGRDRSGKSSNALCSSNATHTSGSSSHKSSSRCGLSSASVAALSPTTNAAVSIPPSLLPPASHLAGKYGPPPPPPMLPPPSLPQSQPQSPYPLSPQPMHHSKRSPLNFVKLPQTGLTCTPVTFAANGPPTSSASNAAVAAAAAATSSIHSPAINISPLNKLQNMQPFDFRKIASGIYPATTSSKSSSRRHSDVSFSDASQTAACLPNASYTSPACLSQPAVSMGLPPPVTTVSKMPTDISASKGNSEFGSDDAADDDDEESGGSQNALNLSKDAAPNSHAASAAATSSTTTTATTTAAATATTTASAAARSSPSNALPAAAMSVGKPRHSHHTRKTSTPMKRQWGSSNLPLNLGTQLINPATGKKRVQCNVCLKTFCDKGALKIHFSAVHLREMHKCTVEGCNMMFSSRRSRNRHSANPNPKLHSPHLRRKISPHDGRSAQAHPILIPPLQAGLNPLAFGSFPLITPPELRHQLSGLDMKGGFDFGSKDGSKFDPSLADMVMDDYDDDFEEGIVVDGAGVDDYVYDNDVDSETNSGGGGGGSGGCYDGKSDSMMSKRMKMSDSDLDEDRTSNTDSNESMASMTLSPSDRRPIKEENGNDDDERRVKSARKRKSQKPTRCTLRTVLTDDEPLSDDSDDVIFPRGSSIGDAAGNAGTDQQKEWDLSKTSQMNADDRVDKRAIKLSPGVKDENSKETITETNDEDDEEEEEEETEAATTIAEKAQEAEKEVEQPKDDDNGGGNDDCIDLCKPQRDESHGESENGDITWRKTPEKTTTNSPPVGKKSNFKTTEPESRSPASTRSVRRESSASTASYDESDADNAADGYDPFGDDDVPLDKDNPLQCTACEQQFANHFAVRTHFQNVHSKMSHKCVVEGCNAAFPSKRSRDRHSSNLNLHRKLLSTSDTVPSFLSAAADSASFRGNNGGGGGGSPQQSDYYPRVGLYPNNEPSMAATSPKMCGTNGDIMMPHLPLAMPALGNLQFPYPSLPAPLSGINGQSDRSKSPLSRLYVYNMEEDMPTPDQHDNAYHCRFCSKPYAEQVALKEHYEQNHLNEMHRCKVAGCLHVFSSRTKRNIHSENRLLHAGAGNGGSGRTNEIPVRVPTS